MILVINFGSISPLVGMCCFVVKGLDKKISLGTVYTIDNAGVVPPPACKSATGKRVAVIGGGPSGLANTRRLIEAIRKGEVEYDFVEIMACPTGCAGGGQPIRDGEELGESRGGILRKLDEEMPIRFSHENASVLKLYEEYLEKPNSHRAHELLHTDLKEWSLK